MAQQSSGDAFEHPEALGVPAVVAGSASDKIAALGEFDVETAQVGLQSGVLDGDQVRRGIGLVEVGGNRALGLTASQATSRTPFDADWQQDEPNSRAHENRRPFRAQGAAGDGERSGSTGRTGCRRDCFDRTLVAVVRCARGICPNDGFYCRRSTFGRTS
jgi:hypothetical protein